MSLHRVLSASVLALSALGGVAHAQSFPNKAITLIVPNPPGGLVDGSARLLSDPLSRVLAQSVVIDNRGGGSGNIAYGHVARSPADGYTLLVSYSAYHVGNPSLTPKLPWAQKDFAPVAGITIATNVIAVHPSIAANTLTDFIDHLKKNPGKVSYASQGNGSLSHIGTEMFKMATGTNMIHIPYRGSGAAIQDVLAGQVQFFMTTPPSVMQHVNIGKLKALAVTAKNRHPGLPTVPTTAEAGLKGFELEAWVAIFAPAGTPADVVNKLTTSIRQALDQADTKTRAATAGIDLRYLTPAALDQVVKTETVFWDKTIKAANITAD